MGQLCTGEQGGTALYKWAGWDSSVQVSRVGQLCTGEQGGTALYR